MKKVFSKLGRLSCVAVLAVAAWSGSAAAQSRAAMLRRVAAQEGVSSERIRDGLSIPTHL